MSDNYSSLEWYRQLSDSDKAYASTYGRSALIAKQKREAEFQQQQQQQQEQAEETEVEEQVEESIEEPEDPFFEQKQSQLEQKQRILDKIENQLDREQLEDEAFQAILKVPQWRELLLDYVKSVRMLIDGWADYYIYTCQRVGDKINRDYEFYKDRKQVTVDTEFHTSSGTKTVAELIAEAEKKKQEYLDQFRNKNVAITEKAEVD